MPAYYNECDPYAAQWLRNLIAGGHIAPGDVDERSIVDVHADELRGYEQCHFFAGIGGWSVALRRAGWPDARPVWTGSCPCQPFSVAGKAEGMDDERHLWPAFFELIRERRPLVCFGEQVASKDALAWLDAVRADVEAEGYTLGVADTCAAGFGAPHIRQRMYWVADALHTGWTDRREEAHGESGACGEVCRMADPDGTGQQSGKRHGAAAGHRDSVTATGSNDRHDTTRPTNGHWRDADWLLCRDGKWRPVEPGTFPLAHGAPARVGRLRAYGNSLCIAQAQEFIRAYLDVIEQE